ncbi:hypothetical protein ACJMK2_028956 [Sinanodonta woodiana]|uniref:17S U2 SnRNP complex component HTATSF1 n=1 Tax=Sinanodonta woodiana TaxID=1069815 RepID=A0ABD3X8Q3_SINWO
MEDDEIGFEEQLKQEELAKQKEENKDELGPKARVDPDGTEYEWDPDKKAWFPKIDADFIAKYQMNYGIIGDQSSGDAKTSADSSQPVDNNYQDYYNYYSTHQPSEDQGSNTDSNQRDNTDQQSNIDRQNEDYYNYYNYYYNYQQSGNDNLDTVTNQKEGTEVTKGDNSESEPKEPASESSEQEWHEYYTYYYGPDYKKYFDDYYKQQGEGQNPNQGEGQVSEKDDSEKQGDENDPKNRKRKQEQPKRDEGWFTVEEEHNTNVYVSGLPFDITDEEYRELMIKYGMLMYDPHTKKPKLKLYRDENGQPKGDGRCCYIKRESVDLALQLLDGYNLRGHTIKVEKAQFSLKGDFDPSKKKRKLTNKEKKKMKEKQEKLFDWRPEKPRFARMKFECVVVLKNMFDPKDFEADPVLINSLRDDVRNRCMEYGEVKKVVVYDCHEEGVVTVSFQNAEDADLCIEQMNHRYYGKRRILAATWDGKTTYTAEETEEARNKRLQEWGKFLEVGKNDKTDTKAESSANPQSPNKETVASEISVMDQGSVVETMTQSENVKSDSDVSVNETEVESNSEEGSAAQAANDLDTTEAGASSEET